MSRKIWFRPSPLKLQGSDLGGESVYDAFHLPRSGTSGLVGSLCQVSIVLALAMGRSWSGADVGDPWR